MCFYFAIVKTKATSLVKNKVLTESQLSLFEEKHFVSGFDHPLMPVIGNDESDKIQMFRWGLVPKYTNSMEAADKFVNQYNTLNAKSETVFTSRLYSEPVKRKRCLVLCSGFFEWRHKEPGKAKTEKYPFYITLKNNELFVFAGIWEAFTDRNTGEIVKTFSILTTSANSMMETIHNSKKRMPVIIEPERALEWLNPDLGEKEIQSFLKPYDVQKMKARTIRKINPRIPGLAGNPTVTAYYYYPELAEVLGDDRFEKGE